MTRVRQHWSGFWVSFFLLTFGCRNDVYLGRNIEECSGVMDVEELFDCDEALGYALLPGIELPDQPECRAIYACECSGSDCDRLYVSLEDCQAAFEKCINDDLNQYCQPACDKLYECYSSDFVVSDCFSACLNTVDQVSAYNCAESAVCVSDSTCDEILTQDNCAMPTDCFF